MDYEKLHKDTIAKLQEMVNSGKITVETARGICADFVLESEGERMITGLINCLKWLEEEARWDNVGGCSFKDVYAWLEKQGNLMKALQISNAKIGELIEENYYLKEQLEKQGNNMGISEATKQKLEDNLHKALEKETPESCNDFLDEQGEQKMITPEESLGIDSNTYNKIVDECIYGEQKPIKEHNACEFCEDRYGCVSPCSMKLIKEEKYTDKVEPKFREGDWVVYCNDDVDLITCIEENGYRINNGGYIPFICENEMRLWDITDAKVGDVLVSESTCGLGTWYCIFKSLDGDESMTVYCYLTRDGRFETKKELCFDKDPYNTKPATKEQRETLMKAMADAGYEWDAEKKELKKVEQKPWSEEDEEMLENIICDINTARQYVYVKSKCDEEIDWLNSIKDRIQPKQKWKQENTDDLTDFENAMMHIGGSFFGQHAGLDPNDTNAIKEQANLLLELVPSKDWSEEDIELLDNTIKFIEDRVAATSPSLRTYSPTLTGKEIPFLKSLKERYTWKPSKREKEALLWCVVHLGGADKQTLGELLEALNKL